MINTQVETEGYKTINGVEIYFKTIGTGTPLLVVHGGPGLAHNYLYSYFSELSDQYQLIFYDQRANGLSSGDDDEKNITMFNMVEDIEELRQSFNIDKLNLIGQSFGGLIAMSYAVKYPEHMCSLLILESATANPESEITFEESLQNRMSPEDKKELSQLEEQLGSSLDRAEIMIKYFSILFKYYFFDESKASLLSMDYLTDDMVRKLFLSGRLIEADPELLNSLSVISCPTLIIHGDYDPIPVEDITLIQREIKDSELHVLKDCGHFAHIEKNKQYFTIIREFLNHLHSIEEV